MWTFSLAPFAATVLTLGEEPELAELADQVVAELEAAGLDVLYDDRDERPGVKFKDTDLIVPEKRVRQAAASSTLGGRSATEACLTRRVAGARPRWLR